MATKFSTNINGGQATVFNTGGNTTIKVSSRSRGKVAYPQGSIGADLDRRNYIRYLVERYNQFRQADSSFGRVGTKFSYAFIFKRIETQFKAPTYFIPVEHFEELVAYLQSRIDQTILGKRNCARGQRNYETFDEYQSIHGQVAHT